MTPSAKAKLALVCVPCALFAACGVDEGRTLSFGFGTSNGSSSSLSRGGSASGESSDQGGSGDVEVGGTQASEGGTTSGGTQAHDGGDASGGTAQIPMGGSASGSGNGGSGESGTPTSAGTSSDGGNTATAGSAGSGGMGGMPDPGPCGDIDHNDVQDCDETLAANSRFDADAQSWLADFGVTQAWKTEDARGKPGSGSLALTFTTGDGSNASSWALAASGQCLPAWGEWSYEVGARAYIPAGQTGRAELSLAVYGNDACAGSYIGSLTPATATQMGAWQALSGVVKMPAGARSVLVRLGAAKPGSQASFEVHFDDVLFRKK